MKKIFIIAHSMEIGGAEKALLGLLENIDYRNYSVDLFLLRRDGELLEYLPREVRLLPSQKKYAAMGIPMKDVLKAGEFRVAYDRLKGKYAAKKYVERLHLSGDNNVANIYSHKFTVAHMPEISNVEYDLAVSFMSPHYYVAQKVRARKKAAWIHTDYFKYKTDVESELEMWDQYDHIVSIAEATTESFLKVFPELNNKICKMENIVPAKYIQELVNEFTVEHDMPSWEGNNILSVGRFVYQKNFDNIPEICKRIIEEGKKIRWYIIGFGGDEQLIREKIKNARMEEYVIILGKKSNPYPYINACDVYIQPSRYEGKSIAVREAQMLGRPVVITDYPSAQSQVQDGEDGVIVPMDNQKCAEAICRVLEDQQLRQHLHQNTISRDYACRKEIQEFYKLLEDI